MLLCICVLAGLSGSFLIPKGDVTSINSFLFKG